MPPGVVGVGVTASSSSSTNSINFVTTSLPATSITSSPAPTFFPQQILHNLQPLKSNADLIDATTNPLTMATFPPNSYQYPPFIDSSLSDATPYCWQSGANEINRFGSYERYQYPQHLPTSITSINNNSISSNNERMADFEKLQSYDHFEPLGSYNQSWNTYNSYLANNDKTIHPQYFDKDFYSQQLTVSILE
uniref:Uncharacterized protein n=1 Tax=Panagrolaimus superbus TaxID=310955 RepID=A0A914YQZ5_9BILA